MSAEKAGVQQEPSAARPRILIVDDEEPILRALQREFQGHPFEISTFSDPREALAALERDAFALVISDNRMPGLTGVELLEQAKRISPDTVRIMLTGYADLETAMTAINKGEINFYLTKPWDATQLKAHVHDGLEKYQLRISARRMADELQSRNAQLADANAELKNLALRDRMTGLYNHGEFQAHLSRQIKLFRRDQQPFCLAMGDIDDFKRVNDTHGHPVGDAVIKSIASMMANSLREEVDSAYRYGGEEFAIILRNTPSANALPVVERLLAGIRRNVVKTPTASLAVTMSYGVGQYREGLTEATLVHDVDKALYRAKRAGKDRAELVA